MIFHIKDLRKKLFRLGLDITGDQIRAMEDKGLFSSTRNKVGYRTYNEAQINDIITSIILHKVGYSVEDIIKDRKHLLDLLGKAVKQLS